MLGAYSSSDDTAGIAHVGFLLSRPTLLGQAQAHVGGTSRRLAGCEQDWFVTAANRNSKRMAGLLPRCTAHAFGLSVWTGLGPFRPRESRQVFTARGFLDLWD